MSIEILPCCVDCKTGYAPLKNDIVVLETMDDQMQPYKLWCADLVQCPKCKHRVITGFGRQHIAEHYEQDFQSQLERYTEKGILFTISGQRLAMSDWNKVTN